MSKTTQINSKEEKQTKGNEREKSRGQRESGRKLSDQAFMTLTHHSRIPVVVCKCLIARSVLQALP